MRFALPCPRCPVRIHRKASYLAGGPDLRLPASRALRNASRLSSRWCFLAVALTDSAGLFLFFLPCLFASENIPVGLIILSYAPFSLWLLVKSFLSCDRNCIFCVCGFISFMDSGRLPLIVVLSTAFFLPPPHPVGFWWTYVTPHPVF